MSIKNSRELGSKTRIHADRPATNCLSLDCLDEIDEEEEEEEEGGGGGGEGCVVTGSTFFIIGGN